MTSGDPFRRARVGERLRIPAVAYNAMLDAAQAYRTVSKASSRVRTPPHLVPIRNDTGGALLQYDVVALGDPLFLPSDDEDAFLQRINFAGDVPATADFGRFAVLAEPADEDGVALAAVTGVTIAKLYIPAGGPYRYADIEDGETDYLRACARGGAAILWHEPEVEDDVCWGVVALSGRSERYTLFPVTLAVQTTSYGDGTAPTAHTYEVTATETEEVLYEDEDVATSPHSYRRPNFGRLAPATAGLAYLDAEGAVIVVSANEYLDAEGCGASE